MKARLLKSFFLIFIISTIASELACRDRKKNNASKNPTPTTTPDNPVATGDVSKPSPTPTPLGYGVPFSGYCIEQPELYTEKSAIRILSSDALVYWDETFKMRFRAEKKNFTSLYVDAQGIKLELSTSAGQTAKASTDSAGLAFIPFQARRASESPICVSVKTEGAVAEARVFAAEKKDKFALVVVDELLYEGLRKDFEDKLGAGINAKAGASSALIDLSSTHKIVYLSLLSERASHALKFWLKKYSFPSGPLWIWDQSMGSTSPVKSGMESEFIASVARKYKQKFPEIRFGIASQAKHAQALQAAGIKSYYYSSLKPSSIDSSAIAFSSWDDISALKNQ